MTLSQKPSMIEEISQHSTENTQHS
jgi:hypothetical protein